MFIHKEVYALRVHNIVHVLAKRIDLIIRLLICDDNNKNNMRVFIANLYLMCLW